MIDATSPQALVTKNNQQTMSQTAAAWGNEATRFLDTFQENAPETAPLATEEAGSGLPDGSHTSEAGFPGKAVSPEAPTLVSELPDGTVALLALFDHQASAPRQELVVAPITRGAEALFSALLNRPTH